jgi:hypothetical protein
LPEEREKRKLWDVDPSIFEAGRKASFYERRVFPILRQTAKFGLYGLALAYPIYLVYVGLAFGGLVFWTFFAGSIALIAVVITKLGYAPNFRHWDISLRRTISVFLGFALAAGFYAGIIYLKSLVLPIVLGLLVFGLLLVLRRRKS